MSGYGARGIRDQETGGIGHFFGGDQTAHRRPLFQFGEVEPSLLHQFLDKGVTYPARSLSATGTAAQYHFYRYNSYQSETPAAAPSYPYGLGVGYVAVDTSGDYGQGINFAVYSTTGYFAVSYEGTTPQALDTNNWTYQYVNTLGHWPANCTFWACAGASDTTPSGQILLVDCDDINDGSGSNSNVTSVDFSGLTALINLDIGNNQITSVSVPNTLQTFYCQYNQLTSFNVSGFTSLVDINIEGNPLTSINISNTAITSLDCTGNSALTSLNVSGCTALATLRCESASITSLDVSGLTSLTFLYCPNTTLTSLNASGCPNLNTLYCDGSHLGTINITGHQPSTFVYTPQAGGYTPTVIGP